MPLSCTAHTNDFLSVPLHYCFSWTGYMSLLPWTDRQGSWVKIPLGARRCVPDFLHPTVLWGLSYRPTSNSRSCVICLRESKFQTWHIFVSEQANETSGRELKEVRIYYDGLEASTFREYESLSYFMDVKFWAGSWFTERRTTSKNSTIT